MELPEATQSPISDRINDLAQEQEAVEKELVNMP